MTAAGKSSVFLVVLTFLWTFTRGDAEICVFMQSCILPCTFRASSDVVIHWIQVTGNTPVHSYYHNQDQLAFQGQNFSGRTSLFKDQISTGNAALQLTDVQVQDQGRYKCYTSTVTGNMESLINLQVEATTHLTDNISLPGRGARYLCQYVRE
ncbi:V-set domain-containing T-cell activation inhibitor 1-like [Micropterus dolomieu]|uniref:V-set domain-containing T-cell activation inhibitor 1-like n=1 Tax=Micropterus dolomieu TaxID=147949 RepID=UPI001E8D1609|nr:V-set domain-containing T-cell activation inhibitor 1-like [Micropterus dolomieu]